MEMESRVRRNLRRLNLFWFLRDAQLWIPVWVVFLTDTKGFSLTQVFGAEGLFLVALIVLSVPAGAFADRVGRARAMVTGSLVMSAAVTNFAFAETFPLLVSSFLLWALGQSLMVGPEMALLFDTLKAGGREDEYDKLVGRGFSLNWMGAGAGILLGGPVAALTSVSTTVYFGAVTCLATAAVGLTLWEAPHRKEDEAHEPWLAGMRGAFADAWAAKPVRVVLVMGGMTAAAANVGTYLVQPYLQDRGVEVGLWFSMMQVPTILAGAAGAFGAARLVQRIGERAALMAVPMVAAGSYLTLWAVPGLGAYVMFLLVFALAGLVGPVASGFINRSIGSGRRATVLSMLGMMTSVSQAGLSLALGSVSDAHGVSTAFLVPAVMAAATLLLLGGPLWMVTRRGEAAAAA